MIYDSLVLGGGFYGTNIALQLAQFGKSVAVLEAGPQILGRASYANQARIHGGYHYPRSFLTSKRSRVNYSRFIETYSSCVVDDFHHYYAIASSLSQTNARQFSELCKRIDAPLQRASAKVHRLFDASLIEEVFEVQECVFDANRLRALLGDRLAAAKVEVITGSRVSRVEHPDNAGPLVLHSGTEQFLGKEVWACAYSGLNIFLAESGLTPIPLRLEHAEMALVEPPPVLEKAGFTVMDGPFFSLLPFPSRNAYSLSHVRYTPHITWEESPTQPPKAVPVPTQSHFDSMRRDASRYVPCLSECKYVGSLWETKALLPRSEENDSRPILFRLDYGLPGLHCVLGGKLDNIFDSLDEVSIHCQKGKL